MTTTPTKAYSAASATSLLAATTITRREPTATDVKIQILYCGVCHSDLHYVRNEWNFTQYPAVPGHEIVGRVTAVGGGVKKFKVGDTVGVGCLVDSCRTTAGDSADEPGDRCPLAGAAAQLRAKAKSFQVAAAGR